MKGRFTRFLLKIVLFAVLFFAIDLSVSQFLVSGLYRYYGLNHPADIIFIGHSHTVLGINKRVLEGSLGKKIAVYAREGADVEDRNIMLSQYFSRYPQSSPLIVYDVNPRLFNRSGLSANSYVLFYPFIDEAIVKDYIAKCSLGTYGSIIRNYIGSLRYNDVTIRFSFRGWLRNWNNLKSKTISQTEIDDLWSSKRFSVVMPDSVLKEAFLRTLALCQKHRSKVLLLGIPNIDVIKQSEGQNANDVREFFQQIAGSNSDIKYLDYNQHFDSRHDLFFDPIHFNYRGQMLFSVKLAHDLDSIYFPQNRYK